MEARRAEAAAPGYPRVWDAAGGRNACICEKLLRKEVASWPV